MAHTAPNLLLFIASLFVQTISPTAATSGEKGGASTEFIRTSCGAAQYPAICFSSLLAYAGLVQQSHSQLARMAISVSLSRARAAGSFLRNLSSSPVAKREPRARMALHDCTTTLSHARSLMMDSRNEFRHLYTGNFQWHLSNIRTWLSAALTNEQTCMDGFQAVTSSAGLSLKTAVVGQFSEVSKVTSNTIALVNGLAANGSR